MGRDDAKPIGGLQGGTAPARAFHDFMVAAVARRPVEQFETEVPVPDWQLEPEEEIWGLPPEELGMEPLVDADGNPIGPADPAAIQPGVVQPGEVPPGGWPDEIIRSGTQRAPQPQPPPGPRAVTPPPPRSAPATDSLQPRPDTPQ